MLISASLVRTVGVPKIDSPSQIKVPKINLVYCKCIGILDSVLYKLAQSFHLFTTAGGLDQLIKRIKSLVNELSQLAEISMFQITFSGQCLNLFFI